MMAQRLLHNSGSCRLKREANIMLSYALLRKTVFSLAAVLLVSGYSYGEIFIGRMHNPRALEPNFSWSPDGRYVAYVDSDDRYMKALYVMDLTVDRSEIVAKAGEAGDWFHHINFSPDGNKISFIFTHENAMPPAPRVEVCVFSIPDKKLTVQAVDGGKDADEGMNRSSMFLDNSSLFVMKNLPKGEYRQFYWMHYTFAPDKKTVLHGFPLSVSNSEKFKFDMEPFPGLIYDIEKERPVTGIEGDIYSPQWDSVGKKILYLNLNGQDKELTVRQLELPGLKKETLAALEIPDMDNFPSLGATMAYLPEFNNVLIGVHLSFVQDSVDGFGYHPNTTGEQFRFYKLDLASGMMENIYNIEHKQSTSPPIPNIIMQPNPMRNGVLVQIHSKGFYTFDLDANRVEKILIRLENYSELDKSVIFRFAAPDSKGDVIEMKSGFMNTEPGMAQWSSDGTKIGAVLGGFVVFEVK